MRVIQFLGESLTRFAVTVTIVDPNTPIGDANQSFCTIDNPTVADLDASGAGIQWYDAPTGGTPLATTTALVSGDKYYASQTMGCESAVRLEVTATIVDPTAPTGDATQSFCRIDAPTVADLAATGSGIKWYSVATGGTQLASTTDLVNGVTYYASQTVGACESSTRFAVTITVGNPSRPTGDANQSFCSIDNPTVADLVITGTGIQWYAAATGGTALATTTALTTGTNYYASQTVDGCESVLRYEVAVTIADPAAPTGSATQTFCIINNPTVANLVATGTAIQWYDSANGGTPLAAGDLLVDGTSYYASQTIAGCESDTRFVVTVTVEDPAAPTGSTNQSFCSINTPTVADLVATGSTIKWYTVATGGSALTTTTALVNGTTYYASQTVGSCESDTRLSVNVTVANPIAPIGEANQKFCVVDNPTLNSITINGTDIKWYYVPTGGTVISSTTLLVSGTTYYASQTVSNCESTSRLAVNVIVDNPGAPTGNASPTYCDDESPTIKDLSVIGIGIKWYTASSGGTVLSNTEALVSGTTYYATQTVDGCESAVRLAVTPTINPTPAVPVLVEDCTNGFDNGIITVSSPLGAGYRYSLDGVNYQNSPTFTGLANASYRVTVQTPEGCTAQSATLQLTCGCVGGPTLTVTPNNGKTCGISPITITGLTFGGSATQVTSITSNGAGQLDKTSSNVSPFDLVYTPDASDAGKAITISLSTDNPLGAPCVNATDTFVVTVNANPIDPQPTSGGAITECLTVPAQTLDANDLISVPANHSAVWYDAITGGSTVNSPTLNTVGSMTYYVEFVNTNQCVSSNRAPVVLTINDTNPPTTSSTSQTFCGLNSPTVANINVTGTNVQWYLNATGGTPLPDTELLKDNTTYYASQNDGTCESSQRLAVAINLECGVVVNDDNVSGIDGVTGQNNVLNVLNNDELSGNPVTINDVILTEVTADSNGYLTLNPDGSVDVAPNTPLGTYTLTYNLCEQSNPTNCGNQPATVTVVVDVNPTVDLQVVYTLQTFEGLQNPGTEDDKTPEPFEPVKLVITVKNNGPAPATGVQTTNTFKAPNFDGYFYNTHSVTDGQYDEQGGVWTIGDMAVGEEMTLTIDANVKPIATTDTFVVYQAEAVVSGNEIDPDLSNNRDIIDIAGIKNTVNLALSLSVVDIKGVDLSTATVLPVVHDASSSATYKPTVGDEITFQLFVENTGSSTATDVELTNILPKGLEYVGHQFFQGTGTMTLDNKKETGTWYIGDLVSVTQDPTAKSPILLITTKVKGNSNYTEHAEVWSNEELPPSDPNHDPNTDITNNVRELTPVPVPSADVSISKSIVGAIPNVTPTPDVDDIIVFELVAKNSADLSDATGVIVTDVLPSGYEYIEDSSGGKYDKQNDIWTVGKYDPRTGLWNVGNLTAKTGEATLRISVRVKSTGNYLNTARITANEGDPNSNNNEDSATSNPIPTSDLVASKTVKPNADGGYEFKLYDKVEYTLRVTNNGPSDAVNIVVQEDFPSQLTFLESSDAVNYDPVTEQWTIASLPFVPNNPNQSSIELKISGIVNGGVDEKKSEKFKNIITVSSVVKEFAPGDETAEVEITYVPDCEVRVYNFVSANGDDKNDYFQIDNIDCYTNSIEIFNRWGSLVYEADNYESSDSGNGKVFKGISEGSGTVGSEDLPSGTYFYILKYNDGIQDREQTGYIQLTR
ncbi:MAG: gliding motility-associated C-terminal domain-containing protein [Flavobacteriales bacterium]|nr:gliding motility-associated C-terminal domain-containing protein [Flavobacteriales bacterium]